MTPLAKVAPGMKTTDNCLFHENKFINHDDAISPLQNLKKKNSGTTSNEDHHQQQQEGGSWIRYIPTLFYTPVRTSARRGVDNPRRGTLDANGVEELNKAFTTALVIGGGQEQQQQEEKTAEEANEILSESSEADQDDDNDDEFAAAATTTTTTTTVPKLGRYKTTASTHKSEKVDVIRSYRLVTSDEDDEEED